MKLANKIISKFKDQRGVTAVVVALTLTMLLGFAALAIDVGYLYATKNELQNIADSAALAAAGKLGDIYLTTTDSSSYDCTADINDIVDVAQDVVGEGKNLAGAKNITIRPEDIYFNNTANNGTHFAFTDTFRPNAVRVIARRDAILNSSVSTFFARIFNINSIPVRADATAALTGPSKAAEGGLPIPIGVSVEFFKDDYCGEPLVFHPTTESCAGWHPYDDEFRKINVEVLPGLVDGSFKSPETEAGDIYYFDAGTNDAAYAVLYDLFEKNKILNDGEIDMDDDPTTWTSSIVVFDGPCYENPNEPYLILGTAVIKIYGICYTGTAGEIYNGYTCAANEEQVVGEVQCYYSKIERGGGGDFGIWGSIPGLVE